MKVLAFDTSSKALSLAILEDKQLLAETTINIKKNHSEKKSSKKSQLFLFVSEYKSEQEKRRKVQ